MQENRPQKEFFEFEKPKKPIFRMPRIFQRADLDGNLTVTIGLEKTIFISIALIMIAVIIYALGVERGKAIGRISQEAYTQVMPVPAATFQVKDSVAAKRTGPVRVAAEEAIAKITAPDRSATAISYAIVVATFRSKEGAAHLETRLRKEGFDTNTVQSGQYFQVCVGTYPDKTGAEIQKQLRRLKQKFKDAYIRML